MAEFDAGAVSEVVASDSGGELSISILAPQDEEQIGVVRDIALRSKVPGTLRFNGKSVQDTRISIQGREALDAFVRAISEFIAAEAS